MVIKVSANPWQFMLSGSITEMLAPAHTTLAGDLYQIGPIYPGLSNDPALGNMRWLDQAADFYRTGLPAAKTGYAHVPMIFRSSVTPNLDISKEQLLKRLSERQYSTEDIKIVDALFGNLQGIPAKLQQRNIRAAFRMMELKASIHKASIHSVAASLCLREPGSELPLSIPTEVQGILDNVYSLEKLLCDWTDTKQVNYFRSLMFLKAEGIESLLLFAARDLIDLEQAPQMSSDSPVDMREQAHRSFMATSWILKFLHYGDDSGKLEDLALLHLDPKTYQEVEDRLEKTNGGMKRADSLARLRGIIEEIYPIIMECLQQDEPPPQLKHRVKRRASAHHRLQSKGNLDDTNGIRIITDSTKAFSCFSIYDALQEFFIARGWTQVVGRDYISTPKENTYQSLHATYKDPSGYLVEIQIRTKEMDRTAEIGSANHDSYKTGEWIYMRDVPEDQIAEQRFDIKRWGMINAGVSFVYVGVKTIIKLVTGSFEKEPTVLDAAFGKSIKTGLYAITGSVDGNDAELNTPLKPGQRVSIKLGDSVQVEGRENFVSTPFAKAMLAIAAENMQAGMDGEFDLQPYIERGKENFAEIVGIINGKLDEGYGPNIEDEETKHTFSCKIFCERMGFDDVDMFFATLAGLPEGPERNEFIAEVKQRIRKDGVIIMHTKPSHN